MQEFVAEQTAVLQGQVEKIAKDSVETVRETVVGGAETLKSLKSPVRTIARSTIKVTNVSQTAVASLIDLQSDMLTSAISDRRCASSAPRVPTTCSSWCASRSR